QLVLISRGRRPATMSIGSPSYTRPRRPARLATRALAAVSSKKWRPSRRNAEERPCRRVRSGTHPGGLQEPRSKVSAYQYAAPCWMEPRAIEETRHADEPEGLPRPRSP